mgnify:CR=1 FL=1
MMSFNSASTALLNLDQPCLSIPDSSQHLVSQTFSTTGARWRASLNQMALAAILPWLREEHDPKARVCLNESALSSFWEFVTGTPILVNGLRLILIPTEEIDTEELRVPQEWVDIPAWVADGYLAVQINSDEGWVQVWGYATHQQLKTNGTYDAGDRAYSLNDDDLVHDLNVLWLGQELCPEEALRTEVAPLPELSLAQATQLLERLGNPELVFPRQAIPFPLWGALVAHGGWRKQLYERRQGTVAQWSVPQWLRSGISSMAEQFGWGRTELQLATAGAMRSAPVTGMVRSLEIDGTIYQLQITSIPERTVPNASAWRFELRNVNPEGLIPAGFKLRLLTEDLQPFEHNEDSAQEPVERLYVEVILESGEGIVWETEPTAEGYDREILKF